MTMFMASLCCCVDVPDPGNVCPSSADLTKFCNHPYTITIAGVDASIPGEVFWPSGCTATAQFTGTRWTSGPLDICPVDGNPPNTTGPSTFEVGIDCFGEGPGGTAPYYWGAGGGWLNTGFQQISVVTIRGKILIELAPTLCPPVGEYPLSVYGSGIEGIVLKGNPTVTVSL